MSHSTTIKTVPIKSVNALRAVIAELRQSGIDIELLEDAKPRMYYADQIKKQIVGAAGSNQFAFNQDNDVCDFVIKVNDSYYDIGLLRNADGSGYTPVFVDYTGGAVSGAPVTGTKGLKHVLGAKFGGPTKHWAGAREGTEEDGTLHSIGKFLQGYTKHATIEAATMAGHTVTGSEYDEQTGECHVHISVN